MARRILIVDDEEMLTDLLSAHLRECGYETLVAHDGGGALRQLQNGPDLILLDINLPGIDGLELCRNIRSHVACPIIFLTARITEQDKVNGLQFGGDDYITKPFSLKELTARVAAHLRRDERNRSRSSVLTAADGLLVDLTERRVFFREKEIVFSRKEFDLIEYLMTYRGRIFDRERIYEAVWGLDAEGSNGVVKEHIRKIRGKLREAAGREYIETIWGVGYKWED